MKMVPGFNTDFKYRGETYHVQTEDNGVGNPVVVSLLYHKGAILASRRTPYHDIAAQPGFERELAALMKNQHKDLMKALLAGEFDKNGAAPAVAGGSGEHPAEAAAAVAATAPTPPPEHAPRRVVLPTLHTVAAAEVAPAPKPTPRAAVRTLDEAIWSYLGEFAARTATVH
jgi:hypothetical protein